MEQYKSTHTGEQIDSAITKVLTELKVVSATIDKDKLEIILKIGD